MVTKKVEKRKLKWYVSQTGFLCREAKNCSSGWIIADLYSESCSNTPKSILKDMLRKLNK